MNDEQNVRNAPSICFLKKNTVCINMNDEQNVRYALSICLLKKNTVCINSRYKSVLIMSQLKKRKMF